MIIRSAQSIVRFIILVTMIGMVIMYKEMFLLSHTKSLVELDPSIISHAELSMVGIIIMVAVIVILRRAH